MNKVIRTASKYIAAFALLLSTAFMFVQPTVFAENGCKQGDDVNGYNLNTAIDKNCTRGEGAPTELFGDGGIVTQVINIMLFLVGILAVIMIIWAGIRYTTAHGDKGQVESAKNTMIQAIVGLIIAMVAYAIVNWVVNTLFKKA